MPTPTNPQHIHVFNGMAQFFRCFIKNFAFIMAPITNLMRKIKPFYLDHRMSKNLGSNQVELHGNTHYNTSKLAVGVSCGQICIIIGSMCL